MYIHQLSAIFLDVLKIYQYYSEHISQAVADQVRNLKKKRLFRYFVVNRFGGRCRYV